jgi:hypothetical protein
MKTQNHSVRTFKRNPKSVQLSFKDKSWDTRLRKAWGGICQIAERDGRRITTLGVEAFEEYVEKHARNTNK